MFTLANTVPNSMYILLAGGVLNTVLVPQIVRAIKGDKDRGEAYTNRIMTARTDRASRVITVRADRWPCPPIIALYSAAWLEGARRWRPSTSRWSCSAYYCMPQVFFYGVLRAGRPGPERPGPVRADDVGADRQQRGLHRGPADLPGRLRPGRHRRPRSPPARSCCWGSARPSASPSRPRSWCRSSARPATTSGPASTSGTPGSARPSGWPSGRSASCWSPSSRWSW